MGIGWFGCHTAVRDTTVRLPSPNRSARRNGRKVLRETPNNTLTGCPTVLTCRRCSVSELLCSKDESRRVNRLVTWHAFCQIVEPYDAFREERDSSGREIVRGTRVNYRRIEWRAVVRRFNRSAAVGASRAFSLANPVSANLGTHSSQQPLHRERNGAVP